MMEWNMSTEYCALLILIIIWTYEKRGSNIPSLKNIAFQSCLIITFLSILSNIISTHMIDHYNTIPHVLIWLVTTLYFIFTPIMGLFYFYYIVAFIYNKPSLVKKILLVSAIPSILYLVVILTNFHTKAIFDITNQGYLRGDHIFTTYIIYYLYCIFSIIIVAINKRFISKKSVFILMLFPLLSFVIIIFQQTHPEIILTGFAATSALLTVYLNLQNRQIYIDYLTKLPNRWELINMLNYILSNKANPKFSLIVLSIREFKTINTRFGQQIGDSFLQAISQELLQLSPTNSVYRFGGDEFAILLEDDMNLSDFVLQLSNKVNKMWHINTFNYYICSAIGIVTYSKKYQNVDSIIESIEYAVISAKKMHKDNVCIYDETMYLQMERKKQIIDILKTKLQDESFEMYYQPIYTVQSDNFAYIESLIRMNDTPIGPIYPSEFIPIAEESGIIIEMTYIILNKVCHFIKQLMDENIPFECVHVNFSPLQFSQIDLSKQVIEIIKKHQIPSDKIKIEFTESAVADSTEAVIKFAKQMKQHGIKMGLDDFGTGYSNISTVMSIPFHAIKLDKSLIEKAVLDPRASSMMKSVVNAFHSLHMQVVAEGVETKEQLDCVISYGIDQIQGYYFSKPLPDQETINFLKQHNLS